MTSRGALIASLALTIAITFVLGSQWDLIASRGSPADPTSTPTGEAETFVDPGALATATEDPGLAAAAGLSLEFDQTSQVPDQNAWSEDESDEDWDDEHEDDHDDEDDEHEDDDHDDD